ncbi:hypothetical protein HAX54_014763 [Datura stramonium]|uniref:Uncharacterized protein n=1 Tax=Datura stramonium TaxID=4076 RepID=A0ABS8TNN5_DATST|nr:hypothetical protein [Datura stramonium]
MTAHLIINSPSICVITMHPKGFAAEVLIVSFSHEVFNFWLTVISQITAKTATLTSPTKLQTLMMSSSPNNSNSLIQVNTYGMLHKDVNSTSGSAGFFPGKSTERTVLGHAQKPAARTPKGVTFLSHGKSLQGDARKPEEAGLSSKADDVGKFSSQIIDAPSPEPSGTLSGMFNMDYGVNKLQQGDMNNSKEAATCAKRDDRPKLIKLI